MCNWGDSVSVEVLIPKDLSSSGSEKWVHKPIDRCISNIVSALQNAGINMRSSCCGHGKGPGEILFQDGRRLVIYNV